ncbi:MAG: hypothetical protein J3K34DRAFT_439972 [Monoraphidium minutum]|nr:MAG: hypothetical protein J3K34DRAFT_439972 [Monoraphidium minutum]
MRRAAPLRAGPCACAPRAPSRGRARSTRTPGRGGGDASRAPIHPPMPYRPAPDRDAGRPLPPPQGWAATLRIGHGPLPGGDACGAIHPTPLHPIAAPRPRQPERSTRADAGQADPGGAATARCHAAAGPPGSHPALLLARHARPSRACPTVFVSGNAQGRLRQFALYRIEWLPLSRRAWRHASARWQRQGRRPSRPRAARAVPQCPGKWESSTAQAACAALET